MLFMDSVDQVQAMELLFCDSVPGGYCEGGCLLCSDVFSMVRFCRQQTLCNHSGRSKTDQLTRFLGLCTYSVSAGRLPSILEPLKGQSEGSALCGSLQMVSFSSFSLLSISAIRENNGIDRRSSIVDRHRCLLGLKSERVRWMRRLRDMSCMIDDTERPVDALSDNIQQVRTAHHSIADELLCGCSLLGMYVIFRTPSKTGHTPREIVTDAITRCWSRQREKDSSVNKAASSRRAKRCRSSTPIAKRGVF